MTLLLYLAAVIAYLAAYLTTGWHLAAKPFITRQVQKLYDEHPTLAEDPAWVSRERREAAYESIIVMFVWPLALGTRLVADRLAATAPLSRGELETALRQRDERIAELEGALGMAAKEAR